MWVSCVKCKDADRQSSTLYFIFTDHRMGSDIPSTLAAIQGQRSKSRRGCRYTDEERTILSRYKDEYKGKTTAQEREQVLKQKLFVDIFNYWFFKEGAFPSEDETKKRVTVLFLIVITSCTNIATPVGTLLLDLQQLAINQVNSSPPDRAQTV